MTVCICENCGTECFVVENPSLEMVEKSDGFPYLQTQFEKLTGLELLPDEVSLAFCTECDGTAVIAERSFDGTA